MEEPAQWLHRSWQTDEGLPDNSVTGLAQTSDGYMWVATRGGLLRFNGGSFTDIPLPPMEEISNRLVRAVFRDRLWFGMDRGRVVCLERGKVRVFGPEDGLPNQPARSMAEDAQIRLWLVVLPGFASPLPHAVAKEQETTPLALPGSEAHVFRKVGDAELRLHVVKPNWSPSTASAILICPASSALPERPPTNAPDRKWRNS